MRQKELTGFLGREITCRHWGSSSLETTAPSPSVQPCRYRCRDGAQPWVDYQTPWGKDALPFIIAFSSPVHQAQPPVPPGLLCLQRMWKVAHVREGCCWEVAVGCVWNGHSPRQMSNMRPVDILWDTLPQLHCPFRSWTQFTLHQSFRVYLPRIAVS